MVEGNFTVNTSVGYQTSPQTLLKFCLSAPELSKLTLEIEQMLGLGLNEHTKHYSDNEQKINRQEKSICHLNKALMTPLKT